MSRSRRPGCSPRSGDDEQPRRGAVLACRGTAGDQRAAAPLHAGRRQPACWRRSVRTICRSSARPSARVPGGATVGKLPPLFPKVEAGPGQLDPPPARNAGERLGDLGRLLPADQDRARRARPVDDRVRACAARGAAALRGDPDPRRRGSRRAALAAPPPARTLVLGTLAVAIPFIADQPRRDADLLRADRRADLARTAVHRAAGAADRPDREGRPPRLARGGDRLRRRGRC